MINFFKSIPELIRHSIYRLRMQKKWIILTFSIGIALILLCVLMFKIMGTLDVKQAAIEYRLVGFFTFAMIWIAVYINYRFYPRDFYVTRHYNVSPFLYHLISSAVYSVILLLLMFTFSLLKPVNTDTSIWGVLYYSLMSFVFILTFSFLLGMVYVLYSKLHRLYVLVTILLFLLAPIVYIPNVSNTILTHILMMNPVYYLVNGMQQSVIVGHDALNHMSYHFYFYSFMGLMVVFCFALKDYVSQLRPNEHGVHHKDNQ